MRKRRTHSRPPRRAAAGFGTLTPGRRRRPARSLARLGTLVIVVVAIGVAAVVTVANTSHRAAAGTKADPSVRARVPERTAKRHRLSAAALHARRDSAAVGAVLRYTSFVSIGLPRQRVIALTFDDGPSPYTPQIIRILLRMHAPATFFVVGQQLNDFAAGLRDEVAHGFTVGDHTENHAWLSRLSAAGQRTQIHDAAVRAQRLGAPFPRLFRPPYGAFNPQTLATLHAYKMLMVLWSIDAGDWRRPGVGPIVTSVLGAARPGAIALLHDGGGDRSQTVAALPAIINGLRKRGYKLVSVPELLRLDPPPRHQHFPTGLFAV